MNDRNARWSADAGNPSTVPPSVRQAWPSLAHVRQAKTSLAQGIAETRDAVHLDMERSTDRRIQEEPDLYLDEQMGRLVVIDEVQLMPDLFKALRGQIARLWWRGFRTGQFLMLGSASSHDPVADANSCQRLLSAVADANCAHLTDCFEPCTHAAEGYSAWLCGKPHPPAEALHASTALSSPTRYMGDLTNAREQPGRAARKS